MALFLIVLSGVSIAHGLKIRDIRMDVEYDDAQVYKIEKKDRRDSVTGLENNSRIEADIFPGSNVTFTFWIENTFTGADGVEIRHITPKITIEDIDDGSDMEIEGDEFSLERANDQRMDIKFTIPAEADTGIYNVVMEAEGDDPNGTSYGSIINLKLEVRKLSHDIRISKATLSPGIVQCDRKAKLSAEIKNAGRNDENEIALEFRSASLGINSYEKDITLQASEDASIEDKTYSKSLNIEVPAFIKAGTYPILVNLYWKNYVLFDQKKADLVVRDCGPSDRMKMPKNATNATRAQSTNATNESNEEESRDLTASREAPFADSPAMIPILIGGIFAAFILIVVIALAYTKAK